MINITVQNLFNFFPEIIRYIKDYDRDEYLSIINNEKDKNVLLKFNTMQKEISIRRKNDVI